MRTVYGYKGINATNVNFDNLNSILIGLHLFFTDYSDEYKENVEERIKNHKGPVIIMDDEVGLDYID